MGRRREGTARERREEGRGKGTEGMGGTGRERKEKGKEKGRKKATAPKLKFMAPPLFRLVLGLGLGSVLGLPTA